MSTDTKPWYKRPGILAILSLALLIAIGAAAGDEEDGATVATQTSSVPSALPTTTLSEVVEHTLPPATVPPAPKAWVEVITFSGSQEKRSDAFTLTGAPSRMRYDSTGGYFTVYIVDQGDSLEKSGGFPEVSCFDGKCADVTNLAKGKGEYYLEVSAGSPWSVVIEEQR